MRRVSRWAALLCCLAGPALASTVDSEHLFGVTEGTDIGTKGEREVELEFAGVSGKRGGYYRVLSQVTALKLTLTDSFRVAPLIGFDWHDMRGVEGLADGRHTGIGEVAFEMKYRALDRTKAPVGLTFAATPHWGRIDEISGERIHGTGVYFLVMADQELIANKLFGAINAAYGLSASRINATGVWEHESDLAVSAALSGRLTERAFLGGEVRYVRAYDGLGLDRFSGEAVFIGPSLYVRLSETAWASLLWNVQVAGHAAGDPRSLDLTNFERHLVKLRIGIQF